ncbi:hypothetical protein OKW40_005623 [Paraburkholderia sp. RAU6.4a]|uniref:hypothetical protein n=1 Tax=Paraburkholderia sp. RAU6.4a TaxID=2991067 RepID=UPI003D1B8BA7
MGPIRGENRTTPQRLPAQHNVKNANQSDKKEREDAAATNVQNADVQKPDVTKVGAAKPQATKAAANESRKTKTPVTVVKECAPFRIGIEGIRTAFIREFGGRRYFFMR